MTFAEWWQSDGDCWDYTHQAARAAWDHQQAIIDKLNKKWYRMSEMQIGAADAREELRVELEEARHEIDYLYTRIPPDSGWL